MDVGPTELIIVGVVLLLVFGGSKIPQLARSLGRAQKEFQKGLTESESEVPEPRPEPSPRDADTTT